MASGLKGDIKQAKRKRGKMLLYARRTRKSGEIKLNIYKVSYSLDTGGGQCKINLFKTALFDIILAYRT